MDEIAETTNSGNNVTLNPGNGEITPHYDWANITIPKGAFYVIKDDDHFWKTVENKFLFDAADDEQVHYFGIQNDAVKHPEPTYYAGIFSPASNRYLAAIRFLDTKNANPRDYFSSENTCKIIEVHPFNSEAANKDASSFDLMVATAHAANISEPLVES